MFKKESPKNVKDTETIIGESVIVEGDFSGNGNIIIQGKLNGNLSTDGHILIGEKAKINADIKAASAFVSGEIKGNIKVNNSLDIAKTAKIDGDIEASSIAMEAGCKVNGHIKMNGSEKLEKKDALKPEKEEEENLI